MNDYVKSATELINSDAPDLLSQRNHFQHSHLPADDC